jgi:hypothetical protein
MCFDKDSLHLEHFQEWAIGALDLNDPIGVILEVFHELLKGYILDLIVDGPCPLICPNSIELCQKVFDIHEVHWTRAAPVELAELIQLGTFLLNVIVVVLKVVVDTICVVTDVERYFGIDVA